MNEPKRAAILAPALERLVVLASLGDVVQAVGVARVDDSSGARAAMRDARLGATVAVIGSLTEVVERES